jgi:hypothetical protein
MALLHLANFSTTLFCLAIFSMILLHMASFSTVCTYQPGDVLHDLALLFHLGVLHDPMSPGDILHDLALPGFSMTLCHLAMFSMTWLYLASFSMTLFNLAMFYMTWLYLASFSMTLFNLAMFSMTGSTWRAFP